MTMLNPYNYAKPKRPVNVPLKNTSTSSVVNKNKVRNKANNYLEQKIMAAKPEELTLMLYDGIIKFIKQAKLFNDRNDFEQSSNSNMRAQAIIEELRATLDMSIEISRNFEDLYVFMNERLVEANLKKNNDILDEVLGLARDFRDTWKEAMKL